MSKLEFDDEEPLDSATQQVKRKRRGWFFIGIILVIVNLVLGAVGGVLGIVAISQKDSQFAKSLGISGSIAIPTVSTQKVVVEESSAFIDTAKKISPSVVSISTTSNVQDLFGQVVQSSGGGTGFIITSDGLILTNKHVVADASATYTVFTSDGKSYPAKIQSTDPYNDLAVVKIEATNLPVAELGDSDQLEIGQWVMAVGNALAKFNNTVTAGIISAKQRQIEASDSSGGSSETLDGLLQIDAAINPGNSGGPLVNLKGQVVGINTAIASDAQGIGFAIPINIAKSAIDSIKKSGKIIRPYLGLRYLPLTKDIAQQNNLSVQNGAWVLRGTAYGDVAVAPGSPADKAGIVENDIITAVNGQAIDENHSLTDLLQNYDVGATIELTYLRKGETKKVKVTLEASK
jgi:S1-C subfamily serine protease